jgi:hypothetical protein
MEKFSVVPEVFYDLIARFIPGTIFLLGLALVIPKARAELFRINCMSTIAAPSMTAIIPLFIILAWFTGFLLSIITVFMNARLPGGKYPINEFLAEPLVTTPNPNTDGRHLSDSKSEKEDDKKTDFKVAEAIAVHIRSKIKDLFGVNFTDLPFLLCFDYARSKDGSYASAVLKAAAESACFRSLTAGFAILSFLSIIFIRFWTWCDLLSLLFPFLLWLSYVGAVHYRKQTIERMLLGLLLIK